ncbi:MAG: adenosine deaminase [Elusimicrobiota bacterium]|nr:adenosine deaminase [Elusimicrobiota bacterium]
MGRLLGLVLASAAVAASAQTPEPYSAEVAAGLRAVKWTPARVESLIVRMPKVEIHVHLDGSLSPALVAKLAADQGHAPLLGKTPAQVAALTVVSSAQPSLAKVLEAFKVVYPLLKTRAAVEEAAYELLKAASKSNTRRVEVRFAPALMAAEGFSAEDALKAALAGLERGGRDFRVESGVILCLLRPDALQSMAVNEETLALALAYRGRGVVGVDLAGDEAAAPLARYAPLLAKAKAAGLGVTVHAGETPGSRDLAAAFELGVDRLGHATGLGGDEKMRDAFRGRGTPIELNLTSNLRTSAVKSLKDHPARAWRALGMPLAVSTDDPGVFGVDLNGEYRLLRSQLGFTPADLVAASLQAVDAQFLPAGRRKVMRAAFERELVGVLKALAAEKDPKK